MKQIDFTQIKSPIILRGDAHTAYRDPAVCYHDGIFHLFFSLEEMENGYMYTYIGASQSEDLIHWTTPEILTPKDLMLNYSSPGNIIRFNNKWILCMQTYPLPEKNPVMSIV